MARRSLWAACLVGLAVLAPTVARGGDELEFGIQLVKRFGWDDLAERHFQKLAESSTKRVRLTGTLGIGILKKMRAMQVKASDPDTAERLLTEAKKLIQGFLDDASSGDPNRQAATAAFAEIEEDYLDTLRKAIDRATDPNRKEELRNEALRLYAKLLEPMRKQAKRTREKLERIMNDDRMRNRMSERELQKLVVVAVNAMRLYFATFLAKGNLYDAGGAERQRFAEDYLKQITKDYEFYDLHDFTLVRMWIELHSGRAYALKGDLKMASEEGFDKVIGYPLPRDLPRNVKLQVENLKLVTFYLKAKAYFDAGKFEKAAEVVDNMLSPMNFLYAIEDPLGRGAAAALIGAKSRYRKTPPDYKGAIELAMKVVKKAPEPWPNNAKELIAKINNEIGPEAGDLGPEMLYEGGFGYARLASQEAKKEKKENRKPTKSRALYEKAIQGFEKTIAACRKENIGFEKRLQFEPISWFELGICYSKLNLWYEARFAFEAVLRNFAKDVVGRQLAERREYRRTYERIRKDIKSGKIKPEPGEVVNAHAVLFHEAMTKMKKSPHKKLLDILDVRLKKSAKNLMVAARLRHAESGLPFDADRLQEAYVILINVDPTKKKDAVYREAGLEREKAERLRKKEKSAEAMEAWGKACDLYRQAAKDLPERREVSYHDAARCYYNMMTEARKLGEKEPSIARRADGFGRKALENFAKSEKLARSVLGGDKATGGRATRLDEISVKRPIIYYALGMLDEVVEWSGKYLRGEDLNDKCVRAVTWTRLKAICDLAVAAVDTRGEDAAFDRLTGAVEAIKVDVPKDYGPALSKHLMVYGATIKKLKEALARLPKRAESKRAAYEKRIADYRLRQAGRTSDVIDRGGAQTLDAMYSNALAFFKQEVYGKARGIFKKILKKHTPEKMDIKKSVFGKDYVNANVQIKRDLKKTAKVCDIIMGELKELIFGEDTSDRPEHERKKYYKQDWAKAIGLIIKLDKDYPDGERTDFKLRKDLLAIKAELIYRLKMMKVRSNLATCDAELAREAVGSDPEKAKEYWSEANEHIEKLREYYWRDNKLRTLQAEACTHAGRKQRALDLYTEVAYFTKEGTDAWFRANTAIGRLFFAIAQEKAAKGASKDVLEKAIEHFRDARGMADIIVKTYPKVWREKWPDADKFIARCDEQIVELGAKVIIDDRKKLTQKERDRHKELVDTNISKDDWDMIRFIEAVKERIKAGEVDPADRAKEYARYFEIHMRGLPDRKLKGIAGVLIGGDIDKLKADRLRKEYLVRMIYQSPFAYRDLAKMAVKLGVLKTPHDGIPLRLLSTMAKNAAIELGILTPKGERKPVSELEEGLLEEGRPVMAPEPKDGETAPPPGEEAPADAPPAGAVGKSED